MYRKIYSHANSIRVMMMMMMINHGHTVPSRVSLLTILLTQQAEFINRSSCVDFLEKWRK